LAILFRISSQLRAPFFCSNASHATLAGSSDAWAKNPPPTMKFSGA
jgi:hypothetical protein